MKCNACWAGGISTPRCWACGDCVPSDIKVENNMQRRELLQKLISAAVAAGLLGAWSAVSAHPHACERDDAEDLEAFQWKLQRRAMKDSSEQSTPMFLALENLALAPDQPEFVPGPFNQELAARFERYVNLLLEYKPQPDESDVAALVELLAEQELVPVNAGMCV
jgi:hypothetical protein